MKKRRLSFVKFFLFIWLFCLLGFGVSILVATDFFRITGTGTILGSSSLYVILLAIFGGIGTISFGLMAIDTVILGSRTILDKLDKLMESEKVKISPRIEKNNKIVWKLNWLVWVLVLLLIGYVVYLNNRQNTLIANQKKDAYQNLVVPTSTPEPLATSKHKVVNSDPIIDCISSHPNCKEETIRLKQSQCSKIYCCGFSDGRWVLYPSEEKCKEESNISPKTNNNSSTTYNYPCKVTSTGYIFNTKDANECLKYQTDEVNFDLKISQCKRENDKSLSACLLPCNQESDKGRGICAWAYTTVNATISNDPTKYGECLDENSKEWSNCTNPCYDKAISEYKVCINK